MADSGLAQITPPKELLQHDSDIIFEHFFRRLAAYRNTAVLFSELEANFSSASEKDTAKTKERSIEALNSWAQKLLEHAYLVCGQPEKGKDVP